MESIKRSEALGKLLSGIYKNQNVNFTQNTIIINDDGIKKTLFTPNSINNFGLLIKVTFTCADVMFVDSKKGKSFNLTKDKVLENTIAYFRDLGIFIPEIANKTEKDLLKRRIYNALHEQILPAIFSSIDNEKEKIDIENDDISTEFNKAVNDIKSKFCSGDFFEQLYVDIKSSDVEKLYDSEYSENECNYGVIVCSAYEDIFKTFRPVPTIYYYNEHQDESIEQENNSSKDLTSSLVNVLDIKTKNFVSPYYYTPNKEIAANETRSNVKEYKIRFNVQNPIKNFIPRYFYFITKLDDDIIKESFSDCKSPVMLKRKLLDKAIEQIRITYTNEIIQYYQKMFANIEDICRSFLAINSEPILSQEISDIECFKKVLKSLCNEKDIGEVLTFCKENQLSVQQTYRYIFCGIEDAIRDYMFMISDSLMQSCNLIEDSSKINNDESDDKHQKNIPFQFGKPHLLLSIENYIPKSVIKKHTRTLEELLKNSKIDESIKIRNKHRNFTWNTNKGISLNYYNDSDQWPKHYPERNSCPSENVYHCLRSNITYYCNALNKV